MKLFMKRFVMASATLLLAAGLARPAAAQEGPDPRITQVSAERLELRAAASELLTFKGTHLDRVTAAQVLRNQQIVDDVHALLELVDPSTLRVRVRADRTAQTGDYELRLVAGARELDLSGGRTRITVIEYLIETGKIDPSEVPVPLTGGGGGAPVRGGDATKPPPDPIGVAMFRLNQGESHTLEQVVQLNHQIYGAHTPTHYRACEDCVWDSLPWQPYQTAPPFTLSPGDGEKTVRFQVRGAAIQTDHGPIDNESAVHTASISFFLGERCFGAVGMECAVAFCAGPVCQVNAGSWEHDECCWAEKVKGTGKSCVSFVPGIEAEVCQTSWAKAWNRITFDMTWTRILDTNVRNTTGKVVFADYCAPSGSRVHRDDEKYCCSGQAEQPLLPDMNPNARICS